jgi:hypothetical protein
MKIHNLYTPFARAVRSEDASGLAELARALGAWDYSARELKAWMADADSRKALDAAEKFSEGEARLVVEKVERVFKTELHGDLYLLPSLGEFDGFARYDTGHHSVLLGVDFPDADLDYLRALTAHELSHVYRDHQPGVWRHLGKPIQQISRREYLNASTAAEHLASEGLATLFSQLVYPEIAGHVHHYYELNEYQWCLDNEEPIHQALRSRLETDGNVWSFYGEGAAGPGSPGRTQYYWAARQISKMLGEAPGDLLTKVIEAHGWPASRFQPFLENLGE